MGSIPGQGTKIPHAAWCGQKVKKKKKYIYIYICMFGGSSRDADTENRLVNIAGKAEG